ncbi:disintegrin and metalloproteinase domain-containing protein 20-like [Crotalus adamanteus]|uniref:Disintegrin and metalloproteinase domain-containing protein 20-like n=1 Tax=Crotalus adamanteus TaxID=8729 RepID=A0AAW1C6M3_CROAD
MAPRRGREPQDLTYLMEIEGKGHVVHLRQKRNFVPKHFPIFTYNEDGDIEVDYPFIKNDCFYYGFVHDEPSSLVTLSSCSGGLRGFLQVGNKLYEIEPLQTSATFQHVVYRLEEKGSEIPMSFFQLEQFVEKGLTCATFPNTAPEFQSGVLKMFMYRMELRALMGAIAIMENALLTLSRLMPYEKAYGTQNVMWGRGENS